MRNALLIVADLGMIKAYRVENHRQDNPRLVPVHEEFFSQAHKKMSEKISDSSGRHKSPAANSSAPMADKHNLELEVHKRQTKRIAEEITSLLSRDSVEICYFAAAKTVNKQILDQLPNNLQDKIFRNVPLDLTKTERAKLWNFFKVQ
ncbi:MAG: host attachment protein [Verrucomicrobia bacterium]|nr:host attachment protein [Verrucomicrobiota bacterium]MCF7708926.1 host attachment protein [Verrucomicrobiota bacterium]